MEGYIRPGCVHLTVQAVLQPRREGEQAQQGPGQAQQQGAEQSQQGQEGCAAPGAARAAGSRPAHPTLLGVVTAMQESGAGQQRAGWKASRPACVAAPSACGMRAVAMLAGWEWSCCLDCML